MRVAIPSIVTIAVLVVGVCVVGCDSHVDAGAGNDFAKAVPPVEDTPDYSVVKTIDGTAIYSANCARCHGDHGEGTKQGISLLSYHARRRVEDIGRYREQVNNGTPGKMPGFREKLTLEEISAVHNHIYYDLQGAP